MPESDWPIAVHTSRRGSGRLGRSAAGRALETEALNAAVVAAIRHRHTRYDQLLMHGYSRKDARDAVYGAINHLLDLWRAHSRPATAPVIQIRSSWERDVCEVRCIIPPLIKTCSRRFGAPIQVPRVQFLCNVIRLAVLLC